MPLNYLSYLRVFDTPSEKTSELGASWGYAAMLMSEAKPHCDYTMAHMKQIVMPAISQKRIKFYFNEDGNVTAYVIWALLAPDVEQRVKSTAKFQLHPSEWNEGDSLWIVDFLAPLGNIKYVLNDLRDVVFKDHESIRYIKRKNGKLLLKKMSRDNNRTFFRDGGNRRSRDEEEVQVSN